MSLIRSVCCVGAIDIEVWSKLKSGRVPSVQEIAQIVETQMRLMQPMQPKQPGMRSPLEPESHFSNAPPNQQQNQPPPVAPHASRDVDDDDF